MSEFKLAPRSRSPLLHEDLFYAIFDVLAEPTNPSPFDMGIPFATPDPDARCALAVLARTCRTFTQPCLDRLWRRLTSLEPLLWCYTSLEVILGSQLQSPSPAKWAIIKRYAHRIQQLEVQDDYSWILLQWAMVESNLVPNLKALKWKTRSGLYPARTTLIQPLLVPGLLVLDFCGSQRDVTLGSFLQACPLRCPDLKSARFRVLMEEQSRLIDILSQALCSFKNLKSLAVDGLVYGLVNDGALEHFLMSPQLQELSLSIRSHQLLEFSPPSSDIPLCNIKNLHLRLDDLSRITEFLRPGNQSFDAIELDFERMELATLIASLFTGLASPPRKSTLREFTLLNTPSLFREGGNPRLQDSNLKLFVLSFDTFQPLTCHTNLRKLIINLENPISLNDDELADLVHNWPLLEIFDVSYIRPLPRQTKQITFKSLLSLVASCPELRQVVLTLDGRQIPSRVAVRPNAITVLRFPNSPINNQARLVAKFLLAHFPSLRLSDTCLEAGPIEILLGVDRHAQEWLKVHQYLFDARKLQSTEGGD